MYSRLLNKREMNWYLNVSVDFNRNMNIKVKTYNTKIRDILLRSINLNCNLYGLRKIKIPQIYE